MTATIGGRRARARHHAGMRPGTISMREEAVERVIGAMYENLDVPFGLDDMAAVAHMSPFHFNRVFRELTGVPPCRFLTALRMAQAKRLLLLSDLSVTEICLEVGYRSLGTFTTHFGELVGVSPRALRRLAQDPVRWPPRPAREEHRGRVGIHGTVTGVGDPGDSTFVGAFDGSVPQGRPRACTLLAGAGWYTLPRIDRRVYVAAVAFAAQPEDPVALLVPSPEMLRVCASPQAVRATGERVRVDLALRPLGLFDPPVLVALPLLLLSRAEDGRASAAR